MSNEKKTDTNSNQVFFFLYWLQFKSYNNNNNSISRIKIINACILIASKNTQYFFSLSQNNLKFISVKKTLTLFFRQKHI